MKEQGRIVEKIRRRVGNRGGGVHDELVDCVAICRESGPVNKIVAIDDSYVWTATCKSDINRWRDIPFRHATVVSSTDHIADDTDAIIIPSAAIIRQPKPLLEDERSLRSYHFSVTSTDAISTIPASTSSINPVLSTASVGKTGTSVNDWDSDDAPVEPVWEHPDEIVKGGPSIVRYSMLNNRRWVVTEDTDGRVEVWDIVRCVRVKDLGVEKESEGGVTGAVELNVSTGTEATAATASVGVRWAKETEATEAKKSLYQRVIEAESTVEWIANWCTLDTKNGYLTVHLEESKSYDAEMYHEDSGCDFKPALEDQRINIGRWVLTQLFICYLHAMTQRVPAAAILHRDFYMGALTYTERGAPPEENLIYIYGQEVNYGTPPAIAGVAGVDDKDDNTALGLTNWKTAENGEGKGEEEVGVDIGGKESVAVEHGATPSTIGFPDAPVTEKVEEPPFVDQNEESERGRTLAIPAGRPSTDTSSSLSASSISDLSVTEPEQFSDKPDLHLSTVEESDHEPLPAAPPSNTVTTIPLKPDTSGSPEKPRLSIPPPPATPPPARARERFSSQSSSLHILANDEEGQTGSAPPTSVNLPLHDPPASAPPSMSKVGSTGGSVRSRASSDGKRRSFDGALRFIAGGGGDKGSKPGSPLMNMFGGRRRSRSRETTAVVDAAVTGLGVDIPVDPVEVAVAVAVPAVETIAPSVVPVGNGQDAAQSALEVVHNLIANPVVFAPSPEDIPPIRLPPTVPIILSIEESSEVGAFLDQFRSTIGGLGWVREASRLDECIPKWVYEGIIDSKTLLKDPAKMSFILLPHPNSNLPELPNNTNRLSSNRMLRIRKLLNYVVDNSVIDPPAELVRSAIQELEASTEGGKPDDEMANTLTVLKLWGSEKATLAEKAAADKAARGLVKPEKYLELCCYEKALSPRMTIATARHMLWKSSGDLTLTYRKIGQ